MSKNQQFHNQNQVSAELVPNQSIQTKQIIISTPESRAICNDPFVYGYEYTSKLGVACTKALQILNANDYFNGSEDTTQVLTILRGGLNFQLREALANAFSWNKHGSWFISAQRELVNETTNTWDIRECSYKKIFAQSRTDLVFGDVVATGTTLQYGLGQAYAVASKTCKYNSITFFTIGSKESAEILEVWRQKIEAKQEQAVSCLVVYFEGIFETALANTPIRIKIPGTDLLRRDSNMAELFVESQSENPAYPLERCTIYDAGSRSFQVDEYLKDVTEYWDAVKLLADQGVTYQELLQERCPKVNKDNFSNVDLKSLAEQQVQKLSALLERQL